MSDKVYVGQKAQALRVGLEYEPVSRVTYWVDDEHYYTAGDDTGREMVLNCRSATQQMADKMLEKLKGFVYRPFEATGVQMDMAAELGDGVTINGHYFMIGHITQRFDALGLCDIGAPGEKEIDHEFPYLDPTQRELKRRVKLGYKYQGVSIDRLHGLMIVETDGETEGAKVILNSKELSFYDVGGGRVLYFDPTSGTYKFMGELNVNDKFVVDKFGNATMKGNLNLSEISAIYWGDNPPNKKRYAASIDGPWHDTMQSGDLYCCDWDFKTNDWKEPYKFVGQDGKNGSDGSDADVTRRNIEKALLYAKTLGSSFMAMDAAGAPIIYGGKIFGSEIYAGGAMSGDGIVGTGSVISLTEDGITMSNESNDTNLNISSEIVKGIGSSTVLSGQSRPLLLSGQYVMAGNMLGTASAIGFMIGPMGIEFYGPVHFNGETTGVTATLG